MRHLILVLLFNCAFFSSIWAQEPSDCVDARPLVTVATSLSQLDSIVVDSVSSSGNEPAEWFNDNQNQCGPDRAFISSPVDKHYWFVFSAETEGTLELMIRPENDGTTYDFALWKGGCPSDAICSNLIYCNWGAPGDYCRGHFPTGVSTSPVDSFQYDPLPDLNVNFMIESIQLEAGENYYLLVQNSDESTSPAVFCPAPDNDLGFTIKFAGTAIVAPEIIHPTPVATSPLPVTDTLRLCAGDAQTFTVSQLPVPPGSYSWTRPADVTLTPNSTGNSVDVIFGESSGKVCMDMTCPIQTQVCWNIKIDRIPDLAAIPNTTVACEPVDLNTRVQDNNNVSAPISFYESEQEAMNGTSPMASNVVEVAGSYWARKTTPNGCTSIAEIPVLLDIIEFNVIDTFKVCNQAFVELNRELDIQNQNGANGDLNFFFYEDSLGAFNQTTGSVISPPTVFQNGTYWIRAVNQSGGPCFDITPVTVQFENAPELDPIPNQDVCGSNCFQLVDLVLTENNGQALNGFDYQFYDNEADAQNGNSPNELTVELCQSGTYWVRAASSTSCFDVEPFSVDFKSAPDIEDLTLTIDCQSGCENLGDLVITERNGLNNANLQFDYFATQADAESTGGNTLADLNICNPTVVWAKVAFTPSGCTDIAQITLNGIDLSVATLTGNQTICAGDSTNLEINFTGDAPFTVSYSDGVNIFDTVAASPIFRANVKPDTTTNYTLVSLMDGNGCMGNVNGTATVTVNNSPVIDNLSQDCNATATEYRLVFDVLGGDTYTVTGINGTFMGNTFTSEFIPTGSTYDITVSGTNGCSSATETSTFNCECNSRVDDMELTHRFYCEREPAQGNYLGPNGESLDKEDKVFFVLHDSPDTIITNAIDYSEFAPIFSFDENTMQTGVTYYISAVVTKEDLIGNPILDRANNPCIDVSFGAPITFLAIPEVSLTLSVDTICQGESVDLTFNIQGSGPYSYDLIIYNGETTAPLMDIVDGHTMTFTPDFSTSFYVQSISQSEAFACENRLIPTENEVNLTVNQQPKVGEIIEHCSADGSKLVLTFEVNGGDPSTYVISGLSGTFKGNEFTSDSLPSNTLYDFTIMDASNCPSEPISGIAECLCTPDIQVQINTVKPVSCKGDENGILSAEPINGQAPYTYFWNNGTTSQTNPNLPPGTAFVLMTDANGCQVTDTVQLIEPQDLIANYNAMGPSCYGGNDGALLVIQVEGGTGGYSYSFDGGQFRPESVRDGFSAGNYSLAVRDENGCTWTQEITLEDPPQFDISLGGNAVVNLGESYRLTPQVNQEIIALEWESSDTSLCANCENPEVFPGKSHRYKVTATNTAGCTASDQILIQVLNEQRVFIPSAFSPNGDGNNDYLRPFSGSEVQDIPMFRVFNRWGELIYERKDMDTTSALEGWNGETTTGREAPTGVYIYFAEVNFRNGTSTVLSGDVSLVR